MRMKQKQHKREEKWSVIGDGVKEKGSVLTWSAQLIVIFTSQWSNLEKFNQSEDLFSAQKSFYRRVCFELKVTWQKIIQEYDYLFF